MAERQEQLNQQTEAVLSIPTVPMAPAAPTTIPPATERTNKLSIGNFLATYIPPRLLGVTYLALSAVIFSIQALFVSLVSQSMPSFQIVLFRCCLQFLFAFLACRAQGILFLGPPDRRKWLFIRGGLGSPAQLSTMQ